MAVAVPMINRMSQARTNGYSGFSWTTLFFGLFPALFRGHVLAALVMFVLALCTFGLSWLVFPFVYNKWHWNWLSHKGFIPVDQLGIQSGLGNIQIVNNLGGTTTVAS